MSNIALAIAGSREIRLIAKQVAPLAKQIFSKSPPVLMKHPVALGFGLGLIVAGGAFYLYKEKQRNNKQINVTDNKINVTNNTINVTNNTIHNSQFIVNR